MIEVKNLTKYYGGLKALDNVTFTVNDGEIVGFVGMNGAGKTTTIKIIAGILRPTSGNVLIDGYDIVREKDKASLNIGWVSESPSFEQDFTVIDYLRYIAGYYGMRGNERENRIKEVMDEVDIYQYRNRKIRELSYGNKKRLALAIALLNRPKNLLLDEVLNGLDPEGIAFFRDLVTKYRKEKKAILFSSHILSEVENIADRVVFINKGRIIGEKSVEEIRREVKPNALKLRVKNPDEKLSTILSKFGKVSKERGDEIIIEEFKGEADDVVSILVKEGYKIVEVVPQRQYLEAYFLRLIGEGNNEHKL
ncbi:MAG: ABC transporter ATP-binding protein [Sulfolobaceae archaeon]|nr:ABC transporter ATP-binding protein [Sulfolobaceae archaeon]